MPNKTAQEILNLSADHIAQFVSDQASSKRLSVIMKELNTQLFSADEAVRDAARRAIARLGFAELA